jgi:hypothetical protein
VRWNNKPNKNKNNYARVQLIECARARGAPLSSITRRARVSARRARRRKKAAAARAGGVVEPSGSPLGSGEEAAFCGLLLRF